MLLQTLTPSIYGIIPAGVSTLTMVHFIQLKQSGLFAQLDYGRVGNKVKYGQPLPPDYKLLNMNIPIFHFYGLNDWLSAPAVRTPKKSFCAKITNYY